MIPAKLGGAPELLVLFSGVVAIPRSRAAFEFFLTCRLVGGGREEEAPAGISPETVRGSLEEKKAWIVHA
jgi:hypothetical protein